MKWYNWLLGICLVLLLVISGVKNVEGALNDNTIFYLTLDDNATSYIAVNSANATFNGTYVNKISSGATTQYGKINRALNSTVANNKSYVNFPDSTIYDTKTFTINAWIKRNVTSNTDIEGIVSKWYDGANAQFELGYQYQNSIYFLVDISLKKVWCYADINDNQYHMITVSHDNAGLIKCYIDGVLKNYTTTTSTLGYSTTGIKIGQTSDTRFTNQYLFNGTIDEVVFFNTNITPSDVSYLWNTGIGVQYPYNTSFSYINFVSQSPSDLTTTNIFGERLNITYKVNDSNRNATWLNYSVSNATEYVNGTSYNPVDTNFSYSTSNISEFYSYLFGDNMVYASGRYNYNESLMEQTSHNLIQQTLNSQYYKIQLFNVSNETPYNQYEIMANTSGTGAEVFYCNSSYSIGNPSSSNNCILIGNLASSTFNHTHNPSYNASKHNLFSLPVNTTSGKVGNVVVTSTSYFLISPLPSSTLNLGYINGSVRNGAFQYSSDTGTTWTNNNSIIVDSHIHQYYLTTAFNYNSCYQNSTSTTCTTTRTDTFDLSPLPPTSPQINYPLENNRYGINTTLLINYTASQPYTTGVTITRYNISLLNNDLTYNKTLNTSTTLTQFNYTINNVNEAQYYIKVEVTDSLNQTSSSISNIFNITSTLYLLAKDINNNASITIFTGWAYSYNTTENITFSSTNANATAFVPNGLYLVHIDVAGNYSTGNSDFNVTANNNYQQFILYLYKWNSLFITFRDQLTNTIINTTNVYLDIISDIFSNNYTTSNGTMYITLLDPSIYTGRYYATGYATRFYSFTINNNSNSSLILYMTNSSQNVTITIIDDTSSRLEGVLVKALRYDLSTNTFKLVEIGTTNYNGETIMSLTLNDEYYKFMIEYPSGTTRLVTNPSYITSTSLTIPISLYTTPGQDFYNYMTLDYDLSFNLATNTFRLNYNDVDGITTGVCLYVYSVNYLGKTLVNDSCLNTASGTILLSIANTSGSFYTAEAYWTNTDNTELFLTSLNYQYNSPAPNSKTGLFLQIILSLVMTILSLNSGLAPIVLPISIVLGGFIGLHSLPLVVTLIMVVVGIIITVLIAKPRG